MTSSMKLRHATAPVQQHIIDNINHLMTSRNDEVPYDGFDRVDYRLEIVLAPYDDDDPDDPGQPVRDLLTDVLHLCDAKGWRIHDLLDQAVQMAGTERQMWGER